MSLEWRGLQFISSFLHADLLATKGGATEAVIHSSRCHVSLLPDILMIATHSPGVLLNGRSLTAWIAHVAKGGLSVEFF